MVVVVEEEVAAEVVFAVEEGVAAEELVVLLGVEEVVPLHKEVLLAEEKTLGAWAVVVEVVSQTPQHLEVELVVVVEAALVEAVGVGVVLVDQQELGIADDMSEWT